MRTYRDLDAWKCAVKLVTEVYIKTESFPRQETYGLTSQIRRAAVSIPSNIAEGAGRNTSREFKQFLHIAKGSACELDTQLLIAKNLFILNEEDYIYLQGELEKVLQILAGLIRYLKNNQFHT